jgi:hypothetical protein
LSPPPSLAIHKHPRPRARAPLQDVWANADILDLHALTTNDVSAMLRTYGVEAARSTILRECQAVFGAYGIGAPRLPPPAAAATTLLRLSRASSPSLPQPLHAATPLKVGPQQAATAPPQQQLAIPRPRPRPHAPTHTHKSQAWTCGTYRSSPTS